jgi:heat shock protein HslJ
MKHLLPCILGAGVLGLVGCVGTHGPGVPVRPSASDLGEVPVGRSPALGVTRWKLISLYDQAHDFLRDPRQPAVTLQLNVALTEVAGYAGHNHFGALTEVRGERVRFWRFYHTQRPGGETAENFERLYTHALSRATQWRIYGQELSLLAVDGTRLAIFRALPPEPVKYVEPWPTR